LGVAAAGDSRETVLEAKAFARALERGARLIGIDLGTKTLGLALSDVTRSIASGLTTLQRTRFAADAARLLALAAEHGVGGFVIGLPINLDGSQGPRAQATRAFARNLARLTPLPMLLWDERLSTAAAERSLLEADASRKRRAEVIDKVAATLILQSALDRLRLFDA
jgi:putative Holliday junction resolvase